MSLSTSVVAPTGFKTVFGRGHVFAALSGRLQAASPKIFDGTQTRKKMLPSKQVESPESLIQTCPGVMECRWFMAWCRGPAEPQLPPRWATECVATHRGRIVDWTGDGVLPSFDGPARAIRCAMAVRAALRPFGLEFRVGCRCADRRGRAGCQSSPWHHRPHRFACGHCCGAGQIHVSSTVRDLAAGFGFHFEDRGLYVSRASPRSRTCSPWTPDISTVPRCQTFPFEHKSIATASPLR